MKTLDYLHLDENAAGKLVQSLQQLLADFQVHYMNLRGFHWNIQGHGFFVLHSKFEEMYDDMAGRPVRDTKTNSGKISGFHTKKHTDKESHTAISQNCRSLRIPYRL